MKYESRLTLDNGRRIKVCVGGPSFFDGVRLSMIAASREHDCERDGPVRVVHFEMARLDAPVWTKDRPTEEGLYWIRNWGEDAPTIARVRWYARVGDFYADVDGMPRRLDARPWREYNYEPLPEGVEWFGPLEHPA